MVTKREFKRKMSLAAQEVKKTGYETGFASAEIEGKIFFGEVIIGGCDQVNPEEGLEALFQDYFLDGGRNARVNGVFHFHPSFEELLIPSYADLINICWRVRRDQPIKPTFDWMSLATVNKKKIRLLLLTSGTTCESDLLHWLEEMDSLENLYFTQEKQEEINRSLTGIGFRVEYMEIDTRRKKGKE